MNNWIILKYQMKQNWLFKSNQRFSKQKIDAMEHQPWSINVLLEYWQYAHINHEPFIHDGTHYQPLYTIYFLGQFLKKHVLSSMLNLLLLLIKQTVFKHDFIMNYLKNVFQRPETGASEDDWVWRLLVKINVFLKLYQSI